MIDFKAAISAVFIVPILPIMDAIAKWRDYGNEYCYTSMEYKGVAVFGCCSGKNDECKECKYFANGSGEDE